MRGQTNKDIEKEFLEPAFKYLVKNGLENTSVRDLCKVMNVSYGSVYYWFEGKDDVYISAVKYGIGKVADKLFRFAFENIDNPEVLCGGFLEEIKECILEFRLVFQVAASPVYGDRLRIKADEFHVVYENYIIRMAEKLGCDVEFMTPIVYLLISILVDYVVWEDYDVSKMQLKFLADNINEKLKK